MGTLLGIEYIDSAAKSRFFFLKTGPIFDMF
jgi:hypothetical protein